MTLFDVFDIEGRYAASYEFPMLAFSTSIWKGGKLYAIGEDEAGYARIVRYTVRFGF